MTIEAAPVQQLKCPYCGATAFPTDKFCSNCGKLIEQEQIGIGKQIFIYAVSLCLSPLGFIWFFRYFRSEDSKKKRIGWIAGILTVFSLLISVWLVAQFFQSMQNQMNSYTQLGI